MKITSLLENTTDRKDMQIEHGLSLYIEFKNHRILFDMGQTDLFYENAKTLDIDLSLVDIAIICGHASRYIDCFKPSKSASKVSIANIAIICI